jgi:hypothetical protein
VLFVLFVVKKMTHEQHEGANRIGWLQWPKRAEGAIQLLCTLAPRHRRVRVVRVVRG